jgi:hypothetical protein
MMAIGDELLDLELTDRARLGVDLAGRTRIGCLLAADAMGFPVALGGKTDLTSRSRSKRKYESAALPLSYTSVSQLMSGIEPEAC